jgi:hypothetical protein
VAKPALKVTACCSQMPTSNARSGISAIMYFNEHPEGMAGVTPITSLFKFANSIIYFSSSAGLFIFSGPKILILKVTSF